MKFFSASGVLVCGLLMAGCIRVPPVQSTSSTQREAVENHVRFLSQPSLKGRAPGSSGSRAARQYIEARFKAFGLVPWGQEKSYLLPCVTGKNVVGVLPGSDSGLAKEIVLISAHYDHLGKDSRGKICPGAADNASGVAA